MLLEIKFVCDVVAQPYTRAAVGLGFRATRPLPIPIPIPNLGLDRLGSHTRVLNSRST